jgi:uncharacterized delta-60 repeat protein
LPSLAVAALSGTVDAAFGSNGISTVAHGSWAAASASVVQSDGRIVAAGESQLSEGTTVMIATRMNPNGILDTSYGSGGAVTIDVGGASGANAIALQQDGKVVLAGSGRDTSTGRLSFAAVRLLPNGALDSTFGSGGITTIPIGSAAIANAISIQPGDGKIVLAGTAAMSHNEFAIARLNANGILDTSFGANGVTTLSPPAAAWGMVRQSNGAFVLVGEEGYSGTQAYMAARITPTGQPDTSFGTLGIATVAIGSDAIGNAVALQSNGDILITGNAWTNQSMAATVRLLPNGSVDPSFGSAGLSYVPASLAINAIAQQPNDGKLLLVGTGGMTAIRLSANGQLDQAFGTRGITKVDRNNSDAANGVTIDGAGNAILSGTVASSSGRMELAVVRLDSLGTTTGGTVQHRPRHRHRHHRRHRNRHR